MILRIVLVFLMSAAETSADPISPPSDDDTQKIEAAVKSQLLDPQSAIISKVMVAQDPAGPPQAGWACGQVQGKNTFGGYAQPKVFIVLFSTASMRDERIVAHIRIATSAPENRIAERFCQEKFQYAIDAFAEGDAFLTAMRNYADNDLFCTIEGEPSEVCDIKRNATETLQGAGWCLTGDPVPSWGKCHAD